MNITVPLAMFGWIPFVVVLFWALPARRAVLAAFLLAWLFLPIAAYKVPMLPVYTKLTAAALGTLFGVLAFDRGGLSAFRPSWIDLPLVTWCIAKLGASLTNGYGLYDGLSSVEYTILTWGLPWLFGRIYFSDARGMRELAIAVAIGGLVYVPFCLFEIRMSPVLRMWIYGIPFYDFLESKRFGGWRPTVFMQHGLMVGMWMCTSALVCWWLWFTGAAKRIWQISSGVATLLILCTAILCKSFGAIALLAIGIGTLWAAWKFKRSWPVWLVLVFLPLYMGVRLSGAWSGAGLLELSEQVGGAERADSLQSRLNSENQFIHAGWYKPLFGFRGWYNTMDLQDKDTKLAIPDALWMIEFTASGMLGLVSLTLYLLLPPARVLWQTSGKRWRDPAWLPAVGVAMIVILSMVDNLFNAMLNPMIMLSAGALGGWSTRQHGNILINAVARKGRPGKRPMEKSRPNVAPISRITGR